MDFLGLGSSQPVRATAAATLEEYTVGSCGPRGFYGTTRKHLELEAAIARFLGTPDAISYSDATATIASSIPAFAKKGDVLVIDEGCSYGVMAGAQLSRARVVMFKHNDAADLAAKLEAVNAADAAYAATQRRFIVVEGVYLDSGDLAPLPAIVDLARKHCWRVVVDDSVGIGAIGRTGRGSIEHCGLLVSDVDVLVGSLSTAFASVGGFCVGPRDVVDHQRLSGAGYCFSASAPPFLCATAAAAIGQVQDDVEGRLCAELKERCRAAHRALFDACGPPSGALTLLSAPEVPVKHLQLPAGTPPSAASEIIRLCCEAGFLVSRSHRSPSSSSPAPPKIRVCITLAHSDREVAAMAIVLGRAAQQVLRG
jgi:serine palmitoyltransferase